ncbi:hypothetical protein GCM10010339_95000 [Streptomyces alanosinicus]|uniref:Uncharacterized protein n=1 Tax=Streptomyces alanosinicus TaxID=68171 RepID=A0A918MHS3_9ACTN|nr:hypothetical protein GCM10010339_95000 [Streptomyces alanosinicus]
MRRPDGLHQVSLQFSHEGIVHVLCGRISVYPGTVGPCAARAKEGPNVYGEEMLWPQTVKDRIKTGVRRPKRG